MSRSSLAGRFAPVTSTICKQMALRTPSILIRRSSLLDLCTDTNHRKRLDPYTRPYGARICNEYSPTVLCLVDTSHRLPHFQKRCRSSNLPSLGRWDTHLRHTSSALPAQYAPAAAALFKQMPLLAPTGRRNQAVYSTSARTPISLSSRIQAPHSMGRTGTSPLVL